jgi:glucose/arabinose dehydrogenase
MKQYIPFLFLSAFAGLVSCGNKSQNETTAGSTPDTVSVYRAEIVLPPPNEDASTVKYSKVLGWPDGQTPNVPGGFRISKFITGIKSPRNIYVADNGDIFVAFANTESKGLKKKVTDEVTGRNESQHTQNSLNKVYLFRDADGDGKPEVQTPILSDLNQPFGMLIMGNYFYVANTDGLWRYPYNPGEMNITTKGEKILELPAGGYNNHWTRNLLASKDGDKIFISIGSASDHGEHGMEEEQERANILEVNPDGSGKRIYASGLRNPVGMDLHPETRELWTVVNERDELGDNLVPDYMVQVKEGGFYGWPYSYFGQHPDPRIKNEDQKPDLVERAIVPDLPLTAHSSSIGIRFYTSEAFPNNFHNGAFIVQRGSWNRSVFSGYRVAFVPFTNGKIAGPPQDFVTGFIANEEEGEVYGRPVSVAFTKEGNMLISDDASDTIWFVSKQQ